MFRIRENRIDNIPDDEPTLTMVDRFVHTLDFEGVDKTKMKRVISTYLVLHMDHGGGNLSTFTGKAIASGKATLYSAMASHECPIWALARSCESIMPRICAQGRHQ